MADQSLSLMQVVQQVSPVGGSLSRLPPINAADPSSGSPRRGYLSLPPALLSEDTRRHSGGSTVSHISGTLAHPFGSKQSLLSHHQQQQQQQQAVQASDCYPPPVLFCRPVTPGERRDCYTVQLDKKQQAATKEDVEKGGESGAAAAGEEKPLSAGRRLTHCLAGGFLILLSVVLMVLTRGLQALVVSNAITHRFRGSGDTGGYGGISAMPG